MQTVTNRNFAASASDEDLIAQVCAGNRNVFRYLVARYQGQVASTVIGMLGKTDEAEDVGQQVFIRFYESLDRFRGEASVGTYLTRIAINLSLNALKRRKRLKGRFLSQDDPDLHFTEPAIEGHTTIDQAERTAFVQQAIQQLPAPFRAVVLLRLIEGYSTQETADILEVPLGTVLSRLARAQKKLKVLLAPYLQNDATF